jgi:hypothetical protein
MNAAPIDAEPDEPKRHHHHPIDDASASHSRKDASWM